MAIDDSERAATALSLYQGALVFIERTRLARTIDVPTATGLVDSLSHLPLTLEGDDQGAIASWIDTHFLPAIAGVVTRDADAATSPEARVLAAFAGRRPGLAALRTVNYEGARYRLDPAGVELARIAAVRERQRTVSLDEVLAFEREVAKLRGVRTREEVRGRLARLDQAVAPLLARTRAVPAWKGGAGLRDSMTELARDVEAIRKAADLRSVESQVARLARRADQELGQALVSLAYAAAIPNPNSTTLMGGDPSLAHDWGLA
jgi:hypothetical protein